MQPQEGVAETHVFGAEAADVHTPMETSEMLRYLVQNCPTKDDLKSEIAASEHRMMAYTDKRMTEAENKFIMPLRREDEKVEAMRLKNLGPFPKLISA